MQHSILLGFFKMLWAVMLPIATVGVQVELKIVIRALSEYLVQQQETDP